MANLIQIPLISGNYFSSFMTQCWPFFFFLLNRLGQHRLITLYKLQMYNFITWHLYSLLRAHYLKSNLASSCTNLIIFTLFFLTHPNSPLIISILLSVSEFIFMFLCFFVHLLFFVLYPTSKWNHIYSTCLFCLIFHLA